jgi:hypothetical protein
LIFFFLKKKQNSLYPSFRCHRRLLSVSVFAHSFFFTMGIRIRPATALSVILAIAFTLELLAILSVPVTKSITLCTYQNIQFGVFGYCDTSTNTCSDIGIGYSDVTSVEGFSLPSNARHTLANLLIVHVVAAGLTLILLVLTLFAHFHSASHSSKYLLAILIFALPCFLLSLLAFLVDILLFVPHLDWGGWIVLAATVLIALFGVLLCIMRRTMSSRKAMKRRDNGNSELQNLNHFNNSSAYMPDGGMVYGGETIHKTPLNEFTELRYNNSLGTEENMPLTHRTVSGNYAPNTIAQGGDEDMSSGPSQLPASGAAQYENFRQHTPSPSREYRTPEYTDYATYRTGQTSGYAALQPQQPQQNYYANATPNYGEYPDYSAGNSYQGPSATAAAVAIAGSSGSVALSQGPQRRPNTYRAAVPPAGTYDYDDGASLAPGSFQEFNVVPVPKLAPAQEYNRNLAEPQSAQNGYAYESSSSAPSESGQSEYVQARSNWRNEPQQGRYSPQNQRYSPDQARYLPQSQQYAPERYAQEQNIHASPSQQQQQVESNRISPNRTRESLQYYEENRYPAEHVGNPSRNQTQKPPYATEQVRYSPVNRQAVPGSIPEETPQSRHQQQQQQQQQQHQQQQQQYDQLQGAEQSRGYSYPSLNGTETPVPTSPTVSDSSHFTSISQRPVNPKFQQQPSVNARVAAERTDLVLSSNPDFQLPMPAGNKRAPGGRPAVPSPLASSGSGELPQRQRNVNRSGLPSASSIDRHEGPYGVI